MKEKSRKQMSENDWYCEGAAENIFLQIFQNIYTLANIFLGNIFSSKKKTDRWERWLISWERWRENFGALVVFKRTLRLDFPDTAPEEGYFMLFGANAVKHFWKIYHSIPSKYCKLLLANISQYSWQMLWNSSFLTIAVFRISTISIYHKSS